MIGRLRIGVMLTLLIAALAYAANESGVALKADSIKSEPFKDADDVGDLKKGDSVQIVSKKVGFKVTRDLDGHDFVAEYTL